jgi:hypothetical protein
MKKASHPLHKRIPKELMVVTPLSKTLAIILFIMLPFIGFLFGVQYQQSLSFLERQENAVYMPTPSNVSNGNGIACTMEAMMCPDGSYVGRQGPSCEFAPCPKR